MAASLSRIDSKKLKTHQSQAIFPLLAVLFTLLMLLFLQLTIDSFCFGPQTPIVGVESLSVSNFTVSHSRLSADWNANLTIRNPNIFMQITFDRIETCIFYKENDALSITSIDSFKLKMRETKTVNMKFETTGLEGDQPFVEHPILREMNKDRRKGELRFSMMMNVRATFETIWGWGWRRRVMMKPFCFNLNVRVSGDSGNGSLIDFGHQKCVVPMALMKVNE